MKRAILIFSAATVVLAVAGDGIRPRPRSAEYPAHTTAAGLSIGAAVIPPDQVRKLFATDLNRAGYLVIEVGVYPDSGRDATIAQNDFMLRVGAEGNSVRAATGETVAGVIADRNAPKQPKAPPQIGGHSVDVYHTTDIGYESGRDPVTGRRVGGVYGGGGVGVGVGGSGGGRDTDDPRMPSAQATRSAYEMQQELENKGLPEGKMDEAVAGYLYFPRPAKMKKKDSLTLTWYAPGGQNVQLVIPASK
jgi:hypothetical protein